MHRLSLNRLVTIMYLFVFCFLTAFSLNGCVPPSSLRVKKDMPYSQPGSSWCTEDGRVSFTVIKTEIPRHEQQASKRSVTVLASSWSRGEGTLIAKDNKVLDITFDYYGENFARVSIWTSDRTIEERWLATNLQKDYIDFKVERSSLYRPGDSIRLYRQSFEEPSGIIWTSQDGRLMYSVKELTRPEHIVILDDGYPLHVNEYSWLGYEGSFLLDDAFGTEPVMVKKTGNILIIYSIRQTIEGSEVEFLEKWRLKSQEEDNMDFEVIDSSVYDSGDTIRIVCVRPEH